MIKKKIEIVILTLILVISTTGLPTYFHYCLMMNQQSADVCDMCKSEFAMENNTSCCSSSNNENSLQIKSDLSDCCQLNFVFNKIEDDFIFYKDHITKITSEQNLIYLIIPQTENYFTKIVNNLSSKSPPLLNKTDLNILNSNFRI